MTIVAVMAVAVLGAVVLSLRSPKKEAKKSKKPQAETVSSPPVRERVADVTVHTKEAPIDRDPTPRKFRVKEPIVTTSRV